MRSLQVLLPILAGAAALTLLPAPAVTRSSDADGGQTERVSLSTDGGQVNMSSEGVAINHNGRYVAFVSEADNVVPGDTNLTFDVFVRDRWRHVTERVSMSSAGAEANGAYFGMEHPGLSQDGRFVTFASYASNLVPGDTNDTGDIFVRDRLLGLTTRVSVSSSGEQGNSVSDEPVISADGRYIAFVTRASNLVPPATFFNTAPDVLVHDRRLGTTVLVNTSPAGTEENPGAGSPSISADGRYVAFESSDPAVVNDGSDAPGVFVRDLKTGTTSRATVTSTGAAAIGSSSGTISSNGRYVAFDSSNPSMVADDTNDAADVFVRDLRAGTTRRISRSSSGTQGDADSYLPMLSHSGRYVVFASYAQTLTSSDNNDSADVFVHDLRTGSTHRISVSRSGGDANGVSEWAAISGNGRQVAFLSTATNLVPGDTNHYADAFVRSSPGFPHHGS
ncbi:TolB family protein [Jidongwangia harbinensis]|uniref:TolB family protein n=1 Tax=Jidongwangia harbinensis TaxID=2878561 RepID=UPI001CDA3E37|nr:hypothetical protein [Jidongwangia harbinensis]MCA2219312.1 hypothetical protein [Jidongwangia harbinensis]